LLALIVFAAAKDFAADAFGALDATIDFLAVPTFPRHSLLPRLSSELYP
jgi:hypothetical protein